jgi:hypothetical protein
VGFGDLMHMLKWLMIYLVYEQELKLYVASSVDSLSKQKGSDATKGSYQYLFILYFEFES